MTAAEKADEQKVPLPRYWVPEKEVQKRFDKIETAPFLTTEQNGQRAHRTGSQLALRKIARATDERTGIFAMIPSFGLSASGTTIIVGSSSSEALQARQTSEHLSLRRQRESR